MNKINKTVEMNFPQEALAHKAFDRSILNDKDCNTQTRAVSALKIVEEEFMQRRNFARENGNMVHFERACKKLLEIRAAINLVEFGLDDGEFPKNKTTPTKIIVE
jgi:hypothetical protein